MKTKRIMTVMVATLMVAGFVSAYAVDGGSSGGGGHAVKDHGVMRLLDFYVNKDTIKIDPRSLPAFETVEEKLKMLQEKMPVFALELSRAFVEKRWLMDPKPLDCAPTASMIRIAKEVVACQDDIEIRFYKTFFDRLTKKDQAGLIFHELVRFIQQRDGNGKPSQTITDVNLQRFVELVFSKEFPAMNGDALKKELELYKYENYLLVNRASVEESFKWVTKVMEEDQTFLVNNPAEPKEDWKSYREEKRQIEYRLELLPRCQATRLCVPLEKLGDEQLVPLIKKFADQMKQLADCPPTAVVAREQYRKNLDATRAETQKHLQAILNQMK